MPTNITDQAPSVRPEMIPKTHAPRVSRQSGVLSVKSLRPKKDQRLLIVGATGTGKTTLARQLLIPFHPLIVIDSKCTYGGKGGEPGFEMVSNPRQLKGLRASVEYIQYRPDEKHQSVFDYDEVYKWCYRRQNIMVYTDEAFLVHHGSYAPDWLRACVTCGRELGIGMIHGTQRPRGIDLRLMTEAEAFISFDLRHKDDRKRMAEMGGEEFLIRPPTHAFWHWRVGMRDPELARLSL
jgi:hypothetical protein